MRKLRMDEVINGKYLVLAGDYAGGLAYVQQALDLEALDQGEQKIVALKTTQKGDKAQIERFRRELKIHAQLDHPHIVKMLDTEIYDLGNRDGQILICVLEWVGGGNLADLLDQYKQVEERILRAGNPLQGPCLPIPIFLRLMSQVADAVAYAHEMDIVHRDIKPSNILLDVSEGEVVVKVADFGTAKMLNSIWRKLTATGDSLGTPCYMSPELLMGLTDTKVDTWASGVMFYELLSGKVPFEPEDGKNWFVIAHELKEGKRTHERLSSLRKGIPMGLELLIDRMLSPNPDDRPTMAEVAKELTEMSKSLPRATAESVFRIVVPSSSRPPKYSTKEETLDPLRSTMLHIQDAKDSLAGKDFTTRVRQVMTKKSRTIGSVKVEAVGPSRISSESSIQATSTVSAVAAVPSSPATVIEAVPSIPEQPVLVPPLPTVQIQYVHPAPVPVLVHAPPRPGSGNKALAVVMVLITLVAMAYFLAPKWMPWSRYMVSRYLHSQPTVSVQTVQSPAPTSTAEEKDQDTPVQLPTAVAPPPVSPQAVPSPVPARTGPRTGRPRHVTQGGTNVDNLPPGALE